MEMLGNHDGIKDVMHIVAGQDRHLQEDHNFSMILEISDRVNKRLGVGSGHKPARVAEVSIAAGTYGLQMLGRGDGSCDWQNHGHGTVPGVGQPRLPQDHQAMLVIYHQLWVVF